MLKAIFNLEYYFPTMCMLDAFLKACVLADLLKVLKEAQEDQKLTKSLMMMTLKRNVSVDEKKEKKEGEKKEKNWS